MNDDLSKNKYAKYFRHPNLIKARHRLDTGKIIKFNDIDNLNAKKYFFQKKYHIKTYGCQANVRDSEDIAGILDSIGMIQTNNEEEADLILLNTCAIRDNAEQRVFGEIGLLKQLQYNKPNLMFALCGCMAQEEAVVKRILNKYHHIDLVFGTHNIAELPSLLVAALFSKDTFVSVWSEVGNIIEDMPVRRVSKIKAFVNITFGCDQFCTYCIVPVTRGKERSRQMNKIVEEVNNLKNQGYKEVTLIGQNVNSYGLDLSDEESNFVNLLEKVALTKIERIRFSTSNPWNFSFKIIDMMKKYPNIMPYIHLPIQTGSEEILRRMNRPMEIKKYYELVEYARQSIPNIAISTDIIVGFPNETDEDFKKTIDLVKRCNFDNVYCFIFSPRPGTPAERFPDSISFSTKKKRLEKLNQLVRVLSKKNNLKFESNITDVLVDGLSKKNKTKLTGYTPENKVVNFEGDLNLIGKIVKIKLLKAKMFSFDGCLVS